MNRTIVGIFVAVVFVAAGPAVYAADPHPVAQPFGSTFDVGEWSYHVDRESPLIPIDHLVLGTEHILDQQCHNGGFGWPHNDCSATPHNITPPILLGVLSTYYHTMDANELVGAVNGGAFDLTDAYDNGEARFGAFTAYFMNELALAADNTTFSTFTSAGLFDELVAGTYGPADLDTDGWITSIQDFRTGTWVNLRPWEFHALVTPANALGQPGQADLFEQAILDGLATLDNTDPATVYSDIIGLAGAVRGIAFAGRSTFPAIPRPCTPASMASTPPRNLPPILRRCRTLTVRGTGIPTWRRPRSMTKMFKQRPTPFWLCSRWTPSPQSAISRLQKLRVIGSSRCSCPTVASRARRVATRTPRSRERPSTPWPSSTLPFLWTGSKPETWFCGLQSRRRLFGSVLENLIDRAREGSGSPRSFVWINEWFGGGVMRT